MPKTSGMQWAIFGSQVGIAATALTFSIIMLFRGKDPGIYLPVITGVIGYFMPAPKMGGGVGKVEPGGVAAAAAAVGNAEDPVGTGTGTGAAQRNDIRLEVASIEGIEKRDGERN